MSFLDAQVTACLKDLPVRLQTAELSVRKQIFADLTDLLNTQTLPENIVKGICKVMSVTLLRYNDATSRVLVVRLLSLACSQYPLVCARAVHAFLADTMGGWRHTRATLALAKSAIAALSWSCTLLAQAKDLLDSEGKKVVEVQANLVSLVMCSGAPKLASKGAKILTGMWELAILSSEATVNLLVLASRFLAFLASKQLPLDNIKTSMLEALNKNIISSKTKTQDTILYQLAPLLKLVKHEEFQNLLPVMNKALLRSPEIALSAVGPILSGLSIDLSQYAGDLSKPFCTSLNSKDDCTRADAGVAMLALCRQCSDSQAIDLLLNAIFKVLGGSEGKITINTHKAALLSAGSLRRFLTNSGVTGGAMTTLADNATNHFLKILETEVHEGTLVTALEMLASWATKFSKEIPANFISWFPKGMALKTTTSGVRCGYLLCLASALHSNTLASAAPLAPSCMKVVENAVKQPGQVAIVSEAVHASACLVKLAGVDMAAEHNLQDFFSIVCDGEKQLFYNEKLLAGEGPATLGSLSSLIIPLLLSHADKVDNTCGPLYHALATCLLSSSSEVRRHSLQGVKKLASTLGGAVAVASLASQIKVEGTASVFPRHMVAGPHPDQLPLAPVPQSGVTVTSPGLSSIPAQSTFQRVLGHPPVAVYREVATITSAQDCMGSCLHNKYSEGQPGQRYDGGNEYVDQLERLAQTRALALYNLDPELWGVNVQPYSGSPANMAVLTGVVEQHGRIMGLDLPDGGHLTHGFYTAKTKVSASSIFFESFPYKVDPATGLIDYDALEASASLFKPKMIIAGISCYGRYLDFARFKKVADMNGSYLMADMAHVAGLVATGLHPSPFEHCDIVTSTVHKTLRGPRAGIIFFRKGVRSVDRNGVETKYDLENRINLAVFPGLQGGPHNHQFKQYQVQVVANARRLAAGLMKLGYKVVTGSTDIHLVLVDMKKSEVSMSGAKAEFILESVSISCNKNTVPGDKSALNPSGIRLGTPSLTTRGLNDEDMDKVVEFLHRAFNLAVEVEKVTGPKLVDWKKRIKEDVDTVEKRIKGDVDTVEMLLLRSGVESNPGPGPNDVNKDDIEDERMAIDIKVDDLLQLIDKTETRDPRSTDEIVPNILIGNKASAEDGRYLSLLRATGLMNCAKDSGTYTVTPDLNDLEAKGIQVKEMSIVDSQDTQISERFEESTAWIKKVLDDGGRVVVACYYGKSRSATIVLAYLIKERQMCVEEALRLVKSKRAIKPNPGFIKQLIQFHDDLRGAKKD